MWRKVIRNLSRRQAHRRRPLLDVMWQAVLGRGRRATSTIDFSWRSPKEKRERRSRRERGSRAGTHALERALLAGQVTTATSDCRQNLLEGGCRSTDRICSRSVASVGPTLKKRQGGRHVKASPYQVVFRWRFGWRQNRNSGVEHAGSVETMFCMPPRPGYRVTASPSREADTENTTKAL